MSRRLSSLPATIFAYAALAVYALAIATPGAFPGRSGGKGLAASAAEIGALVDDGLHTVAPHAPRSDEHLTRQRDSRTAGTVHVSLPVAVLAIAWTSLTAEVGRAFRLESERRWVPTCFVSARTSRGPPDRRA